MKNLSKILLIFAILFVGCTNNKTEKTEEVKPSDSLEGFWTLKSGKWSNDDGTFLVYPGDTLLEGLTAYAIYSKSHFNVVAKAPKMNYFRSEHVKYTMGEGKFKANIVLSNIEGSIGKESDYTYEIVGNTATFKIGEDVEVWEKVEQNKLQVKTSQIGTLV